MKKSPRTSSTPARTIAQKLLFTNARGRLAAFIILAIAVTAIAVTTGALAQRKKRKAASGIASEKLVRMEGNPVPGRSSMEENERNERSRNRYRRYATTRAGSVFQSDEKPKPVNAKPQESKLTKARSFDGDLRSLPNTPPVRRERPEREGPDANPRTFVPPGRSLQDAEAAPSSVGAPTLNAAAPGTTLNFDGLDRENWGAGSPPDTNGDVGPDYYIQTVNTSIGIYRKSDGVRVAAFTFDTFMSQGQFGNLCDTNNFGDPVVLYDTFEDRWIITDFAFKLDAAGNVSPQTVYQCFAASKTGDPVSGGWNFYSTLIAGGLDDYPKFGIWPDGLYMTASMFGYAANASFINPRVSAYNKAQMYAGAPTVQVVSFDLPASEFTVLPSNARLQTGTPPPGTPNLYLSTWQFLNAVTVYKFHVDWAKISLSTFTGPDVPIAASSWPNQAVANPAQPGTATLLDALQIRAMMQNQYTNIGGVESLWATHTVRRATNGLAAPRWYQVNVTGGTVAANMTQSATWDPDAANVINRFMPSLAVDRAGNMALGYSTSSSTAFPSIKYAGRLATDPVNTFSQTEQTLFAGSFSQTGSSRWGDYSAMTLDPDGCTFWFTSEYANSDQTSNKRWRTRVGAFKFSQCTPIGNGALQGTVTSGGNPVSGATVSLGSRTATTDASGFYSFPNLPAGTYPSASATKPGYSTQSVSSVVINEGSITTQNFSLDTAATTGCLTDTTQSDFLNGVATTVDLATSPGDVTLLDAPAIDQQNTTLGNQGAGFNNVTWLGQTFTPAVTGQVTRVDINFFSLNCSAVTMPNLTVSIRNASGNLPTGADLAVATIPGFCNGGSGYFTATFASPVTLTAGTQYAVVWRTSAVIPAGTPAPGYFGTVSVGTGSTALQNPYAGGRRVQSSNSGSTWAGATGNANNDHGFKVYMKTGFTTSGNLVSGVKDANADNLSTPSWGTISWTATTPASTNIRFQAAASNNAAGVFNFVGPDGTASTFFNNGDSLSQFNGFRYLKYKALLTGTSSATPVLSDVTICFNNVPFPPSSLSVDAASGTYGGTTNLSATLTDGTNGISGRTIAFKLNGNDVGSAVTNGSGVATLSNVSLAGINAGSYPNGVSASFVGGNGYQPSNGSNSLTVNKASSTTTVTCPPSVTYTGSAIEPCTASVTGVGGLSQSLSVNYSDNTNVGTATASATYAGDDNHDGSNDSENFDITKAVLTVTAQPASRQYSDPNPNFTYSITGFLGNDTSAVVSGAPLLTTTANSSSVAGTYPINIAEGTLSAANYSFSLVGSTLTVTQETATLTYTGDTLVSTPKANGTVTVKLAALVTEEADGYLGNTLSGKTVNFTVTGTTGSPITVSGTVGTNGVAMAQVSLKADNYTVQLELVANNQYSAEIEVAVVTVVDPGTGSVSGGGWIDDPEGGRGNLGFTVKYVKSGNPQGNNIYIYRKTMDLAAMGVVGAPSGMRAYNIILKSNAMSALVTGTGNPKTATFTGKNTIKAVDRVTGATYNLGGGINYNFQVDITDISDPPSSTGPDTYALRVWTTTGNFKVVGTYLSSGVNSVQLPLQGGNIQVK